MKVHGRIETRRQGKGLVEHLADFLSNREPAFFIPMRWLLSKRSLTAGRQGQSTLEYVIVWTAIVGAILVGAAAYLRPAVEGMVGQTSAMITEQVGGLVE